MERLRRYSKCHIANIVEEILKKQENMEFPIDPIKISNYFGLKVKSGEFSDSDISGMINAKTKEIFIASSEPVTRQRFSVAHELGHYILHYQGKDTMPDEYNAELHVSYRDSVSSLGFSHKEMEANYFAACLLMPEHEIKKQWNNKQDINYVANYFFVSQVALTFRLQFLGLINE